MKMSIPRISILCVVIGVLSLTGWFIASMIIVPDVATGPVASALVDIGTPSDRIITKQIKALSERNPEEAAAIVWLHEDPWLYGVRSADGWIVPGVADDSPVLTERVLPVRVISWTGGTLKSKKGAELDRMAKQYAERYNAKTVTIMSSN